MALEVDAIDAKGGSIRAADNGKGQEKKEREGKGGN